MRIKQVRWILALALLLFSASGFAGIPDRLNAIRNEGCNSKPGVSSALRSNRDLNAVAREWSKGTSLRDALERVDYRMTRSASMRMSGSTDEKALAGLLRQRYCDTLIDPAFKEIGVYKRGNTVWVVVAAPFVTPKARDADKVRAEVLKLVNEARSKPRKCGQTSFDVAPPLQLSGMLNRAALIHSQDMARGNFFEHEGSDKTKVGDRATRVGYHWRTVGENIAQGAENAETVVRGWLDSPGHCSNIMRAAYTEMGVAYVTNDKSNRGIYWTQVFAAPR